MILRYHVTAKYVPVEGTRTHKRGLGSLFHLSETESMRNRAMEIARENPYIIISVCAPRKKDGRAMVYFRDLFEKNILHKSYSRELTRK